MTKPKEFEFLVDALKSLPGVGTKNATRYAFFLINKDEKYKKEFIKRIIDATTNIVKCELCNNITNNKICSICDNENREHSLCIVSSIEDLDRIEQSHNFFGYYHIIDCIEDLKKYKLTNIDINLIKHQIDLLKIDSVTIATNFSLIGEAISEYLQQKLKDIPNLNIYRIGFGIPLNANIDYIDDDTIRESLLNRKKLI